MSYRLELAKTQRSGCANAECKSNGEKIPKGALRHGTMVTINEHQTWKWRHWGCVTPAQIANMSNTIEGNFDYLDGYDELPDELQEKVRTALDNGHVDDEEWKGDIEKNRPGQRGFRVTSTKKKAAEDEQAENREDSPTTSKAAAKKRGRAKKGDDEDNDADDAQEPPKKKSKTPTKTKKAKDQDIEAPPAKKAKGPVKKGRNVPEEDAADPLVSDKAPPPKKARGRNPKVVEEDAANASVSDEPPPPPKKTRGRKPKVAEGDTVKPAEEVPKPKRGRKKTVEDDTAGTRNSAKDNEPRQTGKTRQIGKSKRDPD